MMVEGGEHQQQSKYLDLKSNLYCIECTDKSTRKKYIPPSIQTQEDGMQSLWKGGDIILLYCDTLYFFPLSSSFTTRQGIWFKSFCWQLLSHFRTFSNGTSFRLEGNHCVFHSLLFAFFDSHFALLFSFALRSAIPHPLFSTFLVDARLLPSRLSND